MTPAELDAEIGKLEAQIEHIKQVKSEVESLTPAQQLATALHKRQCRHNHTDGCGWYYEKWTDRQGKYSSKRHWVEKAEKLLATGKSMEELIEIADLMRG